MADTIKPAMVLTIDTTKERYYREDQIRQAVEETTVRAPVTDYEYGWKHALQDILVRLGLEDEQP